MHSISINNDNIGDVLSFVDNMTSGQEEKDFAREILTSLTTNIEFPIDGNQAMKWLGYSSKQKFKTFMMDTLKEKTDFLIESQRPNPSHENDAGGRPRQVFKMTYKGFRTLVYTRSLPGSLSRSYFNHFENILNDYTLHIKTKTLEEELVASKRRIRTQERCSLVYIFQEPDGMIKIGETSNLKSRNDAQRNNNSRGQVVYTKKCHNRRLLEQVVHHILDQYRIDKNREWFDVPLEIAKNVVDSASLFLDGFINHIDSDVSSWFVTTLRAKAEIINDCETRQCNTIDEYQQEHDDVNTDDEILSDDLNLQPSNNPLDFDKFVEECCELGDDKSSFTVDMCGAHRLWGRCCKKSTHDAIYKYLNNRFHRAKIFDPTTKAKLAGYKGVSLKPIAFKKDDPPSDIDNFIDECFTLHYAARVSTKRINDAFEEWKKRTCPDYVLHQVDKKRIAEAFNKKFMPSLVFTGKQSEHGFFGLDIKGASSDVGKQLNPRRKKPVVKVDTTTNTIVERYESLTEASMKTGRSPSYLSTDIRFGRSHDNFKFYYLDGNGKIIVNV